MDHLLTESRNPSSVDLDALSSLEIVLLMNSEDARVPPAVAAVAEPIARAIDIIADRLRGGGRLIYAGAGTSGRLGVLDATECPPTFNSPPDQVVGLIAGGRDALTRAVEGAEDHPEYADADLSEVGLSAKDVLVGIATSGRTPYVVGALRYARSVGASAVGLACVPDSDLAVHADVMIAPLVGPEVLTGSTRLKAGTATKLVLNTLTTGAMVRLGKTYGNLMVDLRATNAKLKARTNRIVRHLLGVGTDEADALLARSNAELKTALVVGRTGLAPDEARSRLAAAGGRVGEVLVRQRPAAQSLAGHVLGVDGGGTHTVALLGVIDDGRVRSVARGEAGPSNMKSVGQAAAFAEIDRAVSAAFANAGLPRGPVAVACLGLAGAGRPEDQAAVRAWADRAGLAETVEVVGDMALPVALLPDRWGVAAVAGTGSSVWGRAADGRTARAGGWGPLLGDEGSAYALALAGLKAVVRSADGRGGRSSLTDRLLGRMQLGEPSQLVHAVHGGGWDRTRLAHLAVDIIRAADEGDEVAGEIVSRQVGGLAGCVAAVIDNLALPRESVPLALTGGLLVQAPTYRDRLLTALARLGIRPAHVMSVVEPAEGALRLAAGKVQTDQG
ncbi:MAG TPA: N-acetylmuramic acid 6-phosphate etherase [Gemmataceae bacterium]|nr:N-acetylmuramic acid 6-phosphate etherase [Gemmataceae bacterium]